MKNIIFKLIKVIVSIHLFIVLIKGNLTTTFILLFTLILLFLADFVQKKLCYKDSIKLLIYIFIIGTEVLGEAYNFYDRISYFDIIMHTLSGFIISAVAVSILKILNNNSSKRLIIIFSLAFTMMIASFWEIMEFTIDRLVGSDMQKDTVITKVTSSLLSKDDVLTSKVVDKATLNNIDLVKEYGGYIDIGLYDTIEDLIFGLFGAVIYIIIRKKSEAF